MATTLRREALRILLLRDAGMKPLKRGKWMPRLLTVHPSLLKNSCNCLVVPPRAFSPSTPL